ncbi:MAG: DUF934 domain-containing protein [Halioglobus sp.]|nr:DUF934 domain-containing protein [Halioglobus sp.]
MPRLIKDETIVDDVWRQMDADCPHPAAGQVLSLDQWLALADKARSGVQLEPGQAPAPLLEHLDDIALVVIYFPVFTDGRGFSYGRELRERGYKGELRAAGQFLQDQLTYLRRCGFNAFQMADEAELEEARARLYDFSDQYQASIDQPLPLFRRRSHDS